MTPEAMIALANACDTSGFPAPITVSAELYWNKEAIRLLAILRTTERDTGKPIPIHTVRIIDVTYLAEPSLDQCRNEIRNVLHDCICHEMDEAIKWGSERPFDPHTGERRR